MRVINLQRHWFVNLLRWGTLSGRLDQLSCIAYKNVFDGKIHQIVPDQGERFHDNDNDRMCVSVSVIPL